MVIRKTTSPFSTTVNKLEDLISNVGIEVLLQGLSHLGVHSNEKDKKNPLDKAFKDGLNEFKNHDQFAAFAETTKKTYINELELLHKYVIKNGTNRENTALSEVFNGLFLLKYLQSTNKMSTKSKKTAFIRTFIRLVAYEYFLQNEGSINSILKMNWEKNDLPKAFKKEQIIELINLSKKTAQGFRNFTIIWVFLGSGIRINELTNLQLGDLEIDSQTLYIRAKRNKQMKVPRKINAYALKILVAYVSFIYDHIILNDINHINSIYKDFYVFSNDGGKTPVSDRTVQIMVKNLIKQAKSIPEDDKERLSPHSFRHSFALSALDNGINIYSISKLLGHENIASTEQYLKMFDDQLKREIELHPFANFDMENC